MKFQKPKRNTPIVTLIRNYVNKKSGKVFCIKGGNQVALRPPRLERPEENPVRIHGFGNLRP